MPLIRNILRFILLRLVPRIERSIFCGFAKFDSWIEGAELDVGESVHFNVPVRVNGKGSVKLFEKVALGYSKAIRSGSGTVLLQARDRNSVIIIGAGTKTSNNISIVARERIEVGENCLIGDSVTIIDSDFHEICPTKRHAGFGPTVPVIINDNVWLGSRVQVMKGVTIGSGTVIAAGSVVTKSLPANVVAGGVPAKVIYPIS